MIYALTLNLRHHPAQRAFTGVAYTANGSYSNHNLEFKIPPFNSIGDLPRVVDDLVEMALSLGLILYKINQV